MEQLPAGIYVAGERYLAFMKRRLPHHQILGQSQAAMTAVAAEV